MEEREGSEQSHSGAHSRVYTPTQVCLICHLGRVESRVDVLDGFLKVLLVLWNAVLFLQDPWGAQDDERMSQGRNTCRTAGLGLRKTRLGHLVVRAA